MMGNQDGNGVIQVHVILIPRGIKQVKIRQRLGPRDRDKPLKRIKEMIRELLGGPHDGLKVDIDPDIFNWVVVVSRQKIYPVKTETDLEEHDKGDVYGVSYRNDKYVHVYSHTIVGETNG